MASASERPRERASEGGWGCAWFGRGPTARRAFRDRVPLRSV